MLALDRVSNTSGIGLLNVSGALTLSGSTVSGSGSVGIEVYGGTVTLNNSTVSGNSFGGILTFGDQSGTLTRNNSTVSGNSTPWDGGGISSDAGAVLLVNSIVSGNSATYAGAISGRGNLTLVNSTVSGNSASSSGVINNSGALTLINTTISGNSFLDPSSSVIAAFPTIIKNTILANGGPVGTNCYPYAPPTSNGHNLSDDNSCRLSGPGDRNNTPAGLDSGGPKNNGGPTQTIALLPGSPAVDAVPIGPINYCTALDGVTPLATDQRGTPRPQGPACDIGAFELASQPVLFSSFTASLSIFDGALALSATFTPGAASHGIDPLTEMVTLQVGSYQVALPPGSFVAGNSSNVPRTLNSTGTSGYGFAGTVNGVSLQIAITPSQGNSYNVTVVAWPANVAPVTDPAAVTIAIGADTGTTHAWY
jgi:hypothetical protein